MSSVIGVLALVAGVAVTGCSSTSSEGANESNNTACTVTLSGALSGASPCNVSATYSRNIIGVSDFSILNTGTPSFNFGVSTTGQLTPGTFTESSPAITMAVTTASNAGLLWSQSTFDPVHGSFSVHLTSVSLGSDGYTFTVHGAIDGTLTPSPSSPGASGTVTFHAEF